MALAAACKRLHGDVKLDFRFETITILVTVDSRFVALEQFTAIEEAGGIGVEALTRAMARELAPGIRVNAIAPGAFMTTLLQSGFDLIAGLRGETERALIPSNPDR